MPEYYADWWWEELPERQKQYARRMGYDQEVWDQDDVVPYDAKEWDELSFSELKAARFLGMDPIEDKLDDLWWEDITSEKTKACAKVLGWDQHKWDDDWALEDLPCEHWWWKDMTDEQKKAAKHFGYNRVLWDEVEDEDAEDEEEEEEEETVAVAPRPPKKTFTKAELDAKKHGKAKMKRAKFSSSHSFGGKGGKEFHHGNNRSIKELTIRHDGHVVTQVSVEYFGHKKFQEGGHNGAAATLKLAPNEYIVQIKVRAKDLVQSLEFITNTGNTLGPCGGMGGKGQKPGVLEVVNAPEGCQLCGLEGRAGACVDAIGFNWGPVMGGGRK